MSVKDALSVLALSMCISFMVAIVVLISVGVVGSEINKTSIVKEESTVSKISTVNPDFRGVKWGMTQKEVVAIEGKSDVSNSRDFDSKSDQSDATYMGYRGIMVCGLGVGLDYFFNEDNKLYSAVYYLTEDRNSEEEYLADYYKIIEDMTTKYGLPVSESTVWEDTIAIRDIDLGERRVVKQTLWENGGEDGVGGTSIEVVKSEDIRDMYQVNKVYTMIVYTSKSEAPPKEDPLYGL